MALLMKHWNFYVHADKISRNKHRAAFNRWQNTTKNTFTLVINREFDEIIDVVKYVNDLKKRQGSLPIALEINDTSRASELFNCLTDTKLCALDFVVGISTNAHEEYQNFRSSLLQHLIHNNLDSLQKVYIRNVHMDMFTASNIRQWVNGALQGEEVIDLTLYHALFHLLSRCRQLQELILEDCDALFVQEPSSQLFHGHTYLNAIAAMPSLTRFDVLYFGQNVADLRERMQDTNARFVSLLDLYRENKAYWAVVQVVPPKMLIEPTFRSERQRVITYAYRGWTVVQHYKQVFCNTVRSEYGRKSTSLYSMPVCHDNRDFLVYWKLIEAWQPIKKS
eukprot:750475-Hanusia_phi.AAC.1